MPSIKTPKRQLRKTEIPIKTVTSWGLAKTSLGSAIKLLFPGGMEELRLRLLSIVEAWAWLSLASVIVRKGVKNIQNIPFF